MMISSTGSWRVHCVGTLPVTLALWSFECVQVMIPSVINSRPTTSSRPSNPLSASFLAPQIRPWLTIVCVYKLYLLTYLLTYWLTYCHQTNGAKAVQETQKLSPTKANHLWPCQIIFPSSTTGLLKERVFTSLASNVALMTTVTRHHLQRGVADWYNTQINI